MGASLLTEKRCSIIIVVGKPCRADLQSRSHIWHSSRLSELDDIIFLESKRYLQDVPSLWCKLIYWQKQDVPLLWVSYEASFPSRFILQILIRNTCKATIHSKGEAILFTMTDVPSLWGKTYKYINFNAQAKFGQSQMAHHSGQAEQLWSHVRSLSTLHSNFQQSRSHFLCCALQLLTEKVRHCMLPYIRDQINLGDGPWAKLNRIGKHICLVCLIDSGM